MQSNWIANEAQTSLFSHSRNSRNQIKSEQYQPDHSVIDPQMVIRGMLLEKRDKMIAQHQQQLRAVEQTWQSRVSSLQRAKDEETIRIQSNFEREWKNFHEMEQSLRRNMSGPPRPNVSQNGYVLNTFNPRCSSTGSASKPMINNQSDDDEEVVIRQQLSLSDLLPKDNGKSNRRAEAPIQRLPSQAVSLKTVNTINLTESIPTTGPPPALSPIPEVEDEGNESTESLEPDSLEDPWIFRIPSDKFKTWEWLDSIEKIGDSFVCPVQSCDKTYLSKYTLKNHLETIHAPEPDHYRSEESHDMTCPVKGCGKVYDGMDSVKDHIKRVHSGAKVFKCSDCAQRFKFESQLNDHWVENHLIMKPFRCGYCAKHFAKQKDLNTHFNHCALLEKTNKEKEGQNLMDCDEDETSMSPEIDDD